MKPSNIFAILDLALTARQLGKKFNPMFTGEAGLGKSEIVQAWVKKQQQVDPAFQFIDLRIAYMEAPDFIGLPVAERQGEDQITVHYVPEFWPRDPNSRGLILLEEPNRGTTGTMNCLMQLLTDHRIHKLALPKGWIFAACVNPDSDKYDTTTMDAALKDRFEEFVVEFDHVSFSDYIEQENWDERLQSFINSGIWIYKTTKELAVDGKYISPRTLSKMNAAELAGARNDRNLHRLVTTSILGKDIGNEYHKFCYDQAPVTAQDILKDKNAALARLREQSQPDTYKGDMIAATIESVEKHYGGPADKCKSDQIDQATMAEIAKIIPGDQAINLIKACGFKQHKGNLTEFYKAFTKAHPDVAVILRDHIKVSRTTK